MSTRRRTSSNSPDSLFREARDTLYRAIEIGDARDERGNPLREEYYLSDSPGEAFLKHKDLVKQLYTASILANSQSHGHDAHARDAERFWESVKPRAQLLAILLNLQSVRSDSAIWTDFIQIEDSARGSLAGLDDSLLPLDQDALRARLGPYDGRLPHQCANLHDDFVSRQLLVCAVRIEENVQKDRSAYSDKGNHLPLLRKVLIGSGSSGKVYRVKVARGHFPAYEEKELAMKQFPGDVAGTTYAREWEQSKKLHGIDLRHASVLTACAALKLEVGALLFFPLASFNLWQYLNTEKPEGPENYEEKLLWLRQLSRVAGAFSFLHSEGIHHGDVKSENILVTKHPKVPLELSITDFGIMSSDDQQFASHVLASSDKTTPVRPGSLGDDCHNRAPESADSQSARTTKKDIWGFGTVLSEVLAWFILGAESLTSFERRRAQGFKNDQYFELCLRKRRLPWKDDATSFRLRRGVVEWFDTHTAKPLDLHTQALHIRFWGLLKRILVCAEDERIEAEEIRQELLAITTSKDIEPNRGRRHSSLSSSRTKSIPIASMSPDHSVILYERLLKAHQENDHSHSTNLVESSDLDVASKCLNYAIRDRNLPLVGQILTRFESGANVIHRAVESQNTEFLAQITPETRQRYPAVCQDMDQPDSSGEYALLRAIESPRDIGDFADIRLALVKHLLRLHVDVNICDANGETPLHYASRLAAPSIVKALLDAGARVNEKDHGDVTPLHLVASAVSSDYDRDAKACVREFLDNDADKKARDSEGKFPLDYALHAKRLPEAERWAIAKLLCRDTLKEQYVFDVFDQLPQLTKQRCISMWEECNQVPA